MKILCLTLLLTTLGLEGKAQIFEEITSYERTFKSRLSQERLTERFEARRNEKWAPEGEPVGRYGLDIVPDTLYAGEPFDVHYGLGREGEATYELYDRRAKRPRRVVTKRLSTLLNGYTVLRITLPEPGEYEVVAWDDEMLLISRYPEMQKSRWTITVYDRKTAK